MELIRKLLPFSLYLSLLRARENYDAVDKIAVLSTFLYTFAFAHIFIGIVFSFLHPELYYAYTAEDSYIEYFTAFILLAISLLCLHRASLADINLSKMFYYGAAVVFFLGFGEEISWGQRIIGFETPPELEKINAQKETNLHNIHLSGVNLNKLIFGKMLYTGVFIYFLGIPFLYHYQQRFKMLVDKVNFPVPTAIQSMVYFMAFFSILVIQEGEKWELQEFALASFLFFAFLLPHNKQMKNHSFIK